MPDNKDPQPQVVAEEVQTEPQKTAQEETKEPVGLLGKTQPEEEVKTKKIPWPLLIILLLILAGALVFFSWFSTREMSQNDLLSPVPDEISVPTPMPTPVTDQKTADLNKTSDSDELEAINEDLSATDLDDLTIELESIEEELITE
ncbi:hypothetical protein MUP65_00625 [Patescibacteria group bacterium]|nr:hypothetical protein [Patescibacteria group bacterium]